MKKIVLAIAAMAFAPLALAAQGQDDADPSGDARQPTMLELKQSIDHAVRRLGTVDATLAGHTTKLNTLSSTVGTLSSTITANHTTIVGKFAPQVAVVMAQPSGYRYGGATLQLLGDSTIPGFPAAIAAHVQGSGMRQRITDNTLPAGTYLFELHQPYSDNVLCNRSIPLRSLTYVQRRRQACLTLYTAFKRQRLSDGFGVYTVATPSAFTAGFTVPDGLTFTDDRPATSYLGAIKITKLK